VTRKEAQKRLPKALTALAKKFGAPKRPLPGERPLDTLLFLLLLDRAPERKAERAFKRLGESVVDWNELRVSYPIEVQEMIADTADSFEKAHKLVRVLNGVFNRHNRLALDDLEGMERDKALRFLAGIEGMEWSDAAQLMLIQFDAPILPVDEGMLRVLKRMGVCKEDADVQDASKAVAGMIPKTKYWDAFRLFSLLAVGACAAEAPACARCPIRSLCATGQEGRTSSKGTTRRRAKAKRAR